MKLKELKGLREVEFTCRRQGGVVEFTPNQSPIKSLITTEAAVAPNTAGKYEMVP